MDLTPSQVASASFRTVRKGYDPDEVAAFLEQAAKALEESQQQATAMEARHVRTLDSAPMTKGGIDPIGFITMLQHRLYVES